MIHPIRLGQEENGPIAEVQWTGDGWVYRYRPSQEWRPLRPHMYHPRLEQTLQELRGVAA